MAISAFPACITRFLEPKRHHFHFFMNKSFFATKLNNTLMFFNIRTLFRQH